MQLMLEFILKVKSFTRMNPIDQMNALENQASLIDMENRAITRNKHIAIALSKMENLSVVCIDEFSSKALKIVLKNFC